MNTKTTFVAVMSPIINTVTTTFKQCRPNEINNISILYITNAQSNRKYFCYKYEGTKQHNDVEGATSNRVYYTSDSYNKNKENMRKYGYRALRKARLKMHHKCWQDMRNKKLTN